MFATEWGTCNADGNGQLDLPSTNTWLNFFKGHHISDANWAVYDKNEACAALVPGANPNGGGEFSASGNFIRNSIRGDSGGGGGGSGCCRFGADCGDCGLDGTGWCHQSAMTWEVYRSLAFQLPRKKENGFDETIITWKNHCKCGNNLGRFLESILETIRN